MLFGSTFFWGCGQFRSEGQPDYLARVNNSYLSKKDVEKEIPKNSSAEDSAVFVENYITRWATKQLLVDGAKRNLSEKKQREFNDLVNDYRQELYTEAYKDVIISKKLDTTLTEQEIKNYFEDNKSNFKVNRNLVKLRYVKLPKNFPAENKIKEQFKRFNADDQAALNNETLKFGAYSLNDSVWVSTRALYKKIPPLEVEDSDKFLKKDKYIELNDSIGLYLIFVKNVRLRNEQAPLSYVKPALKQILLNKRKLKIEKELEKDITKDAIENKTFEIYN